MHIRIVAINNLNDRFRKIAIKRLKQKDDVIILEVDNVIELSKIGKLKKYLNKLEMEEKTITFIPNNKQEEEMLIHILSDKINIIDGSRWCDSSFHFLFNIDNYFNSKSKFSGNVKLPPEYNNIPKDYQDTVYNIYEEFNNLDNEVLFLLVTGSVNRGCVYDGWSDIDLIVVLKNKNDQETRNNISDIVNKQKIKVGTTVYSKDEFESLVVDYKTVAAICDVNSGVYRPLICSEELDIPNVSREELIIRAYEKIPDMLHSMRRYTYKGCKIDYIKLFKDLSHFMRILDWMENMYPKSYEEVAITFNKIYGSVLYSPNGFLKSVTTGENIDEERELVLEKTKEFLDFCDSYLLGIDGDIDDRKVRKLQN